MTMPQRRDTGDRGPLPITDDQKLWILSPISRFMPEFWNSPPFDSEADARFIYEEYGDEIRRQYGGEYPEKALPGSRGWRDYWKHAGGD